MRTPKLDPRPLVFAAVLCVGALAPACGGADPGLDPAMGEDSAGDEATATVITRGMYTSSDGPVANGAVIGFDLNGVQTGHATTDANGKYELTTRGKPAQLAFKAYQRVPKFVVS